MRAFRSRVIGPALRHFGGPQTIVEMGMTFCSSRLNLTAVERGVFTELAGGAASSPATFSSCALPAPM
jgi:hypothetical protein